MHNCPDCKDTGEITLLTSTVPCRCRQTEPCAAQQRDRQPPVDDVCFGTINGVTLSQMAIDMETVGATLQDAADNATFTLECKTDDGEVTTFTGLNKHAVNFVHACLKAGWGPERVRDHLEEMETERKVRERQRHLADLEAAGYPEHDIKAMAERIEERLFSVSDDGEAVQIITEEVSHLILRKVIRGAMKCLVPNVQTMPKAGLATGGVVRQCRFSFMPETACGGFPAPLGKTEFYRRLFGGKPDPSIDISEFETRIKEYSHE